MKNYISEDLFIHRNGKVGFWAYLDQSLDLRWSFDLDDTWGLACFTIDIDWFAKKLISKVLSELFSQAVGNKTRIVWQGRSMCFL